MWWCFFVFRYWGSSALHSRFLCPACWDSASEAEIGGWELNPGRIRIAKPKFLGFFVADPNLPSLLSNLTIPILRMPRRSWRIRSDAGSAFARPPAPWWFWKRRACQNTFQGYLVWIPQATFPQSFVSSRTVARLGMCHIYFSRIRLLFYIRPHTCIYIYMYIIPYTIIS